MAVATYPLDRPGEMHIRNVLRDGSLVAVLMAIDQGDAFTVVTEVYGQGPASGAVTRRPYTFTDAEDGMAFFSEALTSFTYLGCEVRQP